MDAVEELLVAQGLEVAADAQRVVIVDGSDDLVAAARGQWPEVRSWRDVGPGPDGLLGAPELAGAELVLMVAPKALAALDEYAGLVAAHAAAGVRLVVAERIKHLTRSMNEVLARHFGQVRASLGVRKARALHAAEPLGRAADAWPQRAEHADLGLTLCAHGACFGGTKVDLGTRLLLSALDADPAFAPLAEPAPNSRIDAIDLGCGNGTIAAWLAQRGFTVTALDVSRAAIASTRATAGANGVGVTARLADGLAEEPAGSQRLIVCNPPFHVGHAKDSGPALAMIADAGRVLAPGGELWLVWNAHLPYLPALRREVGPTEIVARDPKFIVTRSVRR